MMKKSFAAGFIAAIVLIAGRAAWAEDDIDPGALAKALSEASVSLDQGLKASEPEGKPISGKYELDDRALQLSVYTMKGDKFTEVIVDYMSGTIKKADPITDGDDLKNANQQAEAMAEAKSSLEKAVGDAVKANPGYLAVSAIPAMSGGRPEASITLLKGAEIKKVAEGLN
jgi:hypothetical protein